MSSDPFDLSTLLEEIRKAESISALGNSLADPEAQASRDGMLPVELSGSAGPLSDPSIPVAPLITPKQREAWAETAWEDGQVIAFVSY